MAEFIIYSQNGRVHCAISYYNKKRNKHREVLRTERKAIDIPPEHEGKSIAQLEQIFAKEIDAVKAEISQAQ